MATARTSMMAEGFASGSGSSGSGSSGSSSRDSFSTVELLPSTTTAAATTTTTTTTTTSMLVFPPTPPPTTPGAESSAASCHHASRSGSCSYHPPAALARPSQQQQQQQQQSDTAPPSKRRRIRLAPEPALPSLLAAPIVKNPLQLPSTAARSTCSQVPVRARAYLAAEQAQLRHAYDELRTDTATLHLQRNELRYARRVLDERIAALSDRIHNSQAHEDELHPPQDGYQRKAKAATAQDIIMPHGASKRVVTSDRIAQTCFDRERAQDAAVVETASSAAALLSQFRPKTAAVFHQAAAAPDSHSDNLLLHEAINRYLYPATVDRGRSFAPPAPVPLRKRYSQTPRRKGSEPTKPTKPTKPGKPTKPSKPRISRGKKSPAAPAPAPPQHQPPLLPQVQQQTSPAFFPQQPQSLSNDLQARADFPELFSTLPISISMQQPIPVTAIHSTPEPAPAPAPSSNTLATANTATSAAPLPLPASAPPLPTTASTPPSAAAFANDIHADEPEKELWQQFIERLLTAAPPIVPGSESDPATMPFDDDDDDGGGGGGGANLLAESGCAEGLRALEADAPCAQADGSGEEDHHDDDEDDEEEEEEEGEGEDAVEDDEDKEGAEAEEEKEGVLLAGRPHGEAEEEALKAFQALGEPAQEHGHGLGGEPGLDMHDMDFETLMAHLAH
ncbi:hypothetical protein OC842_002686 [Tilletia horrida]|uniref:Uncharacterized protein n=1 Tax=Tilletia horrida TaxID=155126 RepID=A0AAN6JRY9_9BASI|nr:hypothetical protein OC842_002686 [Tilletia horrida]